MGKLHKVKNITIDDHFSFSQT